jgi:hypothetical protein
MRVLASTVQQWRRRAVDPAWATHAASTLCDGFNLTAAEWPTVKSVLATVHYVTVCQCLGAIDSITQPPMKAQVMIIGPIHS